jgi:hypothetical protein
MLWGFGLYSTGSGYGNETYNFIKGEKFDKPVTVTSQESLCSLESETNLPVYMGTFTGSFVL